MPTGFNFAALGNALIPYNPGLAATQFLAISAVGGTGLGLKLAYAGIGATAGAIGAGKTTNWDLTSTLMGAGIGSLTGGAGGYLGDLFEVTGLGGVGLSSLTGGVSGFASTASMNALTGQPTFNNVCYATTIGALGPLASGEAFVIGGAGYAADSVLGYALNAGSDIVTVILGP